MGFVFSKEKKQKQKPVKKPNPQDQVQNVDVVKSKLKVARDRVNNIIKSKNADIQKINQQIQE